MVTINFYKIGVFTLLIVTIVFLITSFTSDLGLKKVNNSESILQLQDAGERAIQEYSNITNNTLNKLENSSGIAQTITFIPGIVIDGIKILKNILLVTKDYFIIIATNLGVPPIILSIIGILLILLTIVLILRGIGGNI